MSEKIIFLDVDGVLNYMSYRNKSTANIDPSKVEMLAYICAQTNAKVVITSSWRGSETYTPRIYYILLDILKEHHVPVLGDGNTIGHISERFHKQFSRKMSYKDMVQYIHEHETSKYTNHVFTFTFTKTGGMKAYA